MANYVLIHGGLRNGNDWNAVAEILRQKGHIAYTPSLSDFQNSTLTIHIKEICDFINDNNLDRIILVGHSYGTMVITGVASQLRKKIVHLVYIDGTVPQNGQSLYDQFVRSGAIWRDTVKVVPAYKEKIFFDETSIIDLQKTYIRCLKSDPSILITTAAMCQHISLVADIHHWHFLTLEADHLCILSNPKGIAGYLLDLTRS